MPRRGGGARGRTGAGTEGGSATDNSNKERRRLREREKMRPTGIVGERMVKTEADREKRGVERNGALGREKMPGSVCSIRG